MRRVTPWGWGGAAYATGLVGLLVNEKEKSD